jgi:hypothetical protein
MKHERPVLALEPGEKAEGLGRGDDAFNHVALLSGSRAARDRSLAPPDAAQKKPKAFGL